MRPPHQNARPGYLSSSVNPCCPHRQIALLNPSTGCRSLQLSSLSQHLSAHGQNSPHHNLWTPVRGQQISRYSQSLQQQKPVQADLREGAKKYSQFRNGYGFKCRQHRQCKLNLSPVGKTAATGVAQDTMESTVLFPVIKSFNRKNRALCQPNTGINAIQTRPGSNVTAAAVAESKETFRPVKEAEANARKELLIATAVTNEAGEFVFEVSENNLEQAFDIDFVCGSVPHRPIPPGGKRVSISHYAKWIRDEHENLLYNWNYAISGKW